MIYEVEMTDTFGGEANYCWVRRERFEAPDTATTRSLVRLAKKALGVTGKHQTENHGDTIAIYPRGACIVLFVDPIADLDTLEIMTNNGICITRVGNGV